ncbi:cellulose biosynthesis protein BcsR, partial [Cronobacter sakazakii]
MPADILAVPVTLSVEEDDIDLLRRSLDMPGLPYVDFSAQQERARALARWPLLAEL